MEFVVTSDDLGVLARSLDGIDRRMRQGLITGMKHAAEPTKTKIRSSARRQLPSRGGLAALVASSRVTTKARTTGSRPTVRIEANLPGYALDALDRGTVRHPVFGHRAWVTQRVDPGWFSEPIKQDAARMQREVQKAIERVVTDSLAPLS